MVTLQEQFEKDFPNKSVRDISTYEKYKNSDFTNYDLDLKEYKNLERLYLSYYYYGKTISINLSECKNLTFLRLDYGCPTFLDLSELKGLKGLILVRANLTSLDFLNTLSNPEKLEGLQVWNNNIQPTDIEVFSKFVNLKALKIGMSSEIDLEKKCNRFYGSFKSWKNLTKLESVCIEATDVNEGLEYLPESLAKATPRGGKYYSIECSPHDTNSKCKAIQDQLRPFNYDLEAWQLAHPEKMLISRPEYFTNPDSKDKWIEVLNKKLSESHQLLVQTKEQEADKIKKIARLESKISELETAKSTISQQTQTEFSTQNKSTQTNLTMEQIEKWEQADKKKPCIKSLLKNMVKNNKLTFLI